MELLKHPFFAGIFTEDPSVTRIKRQKERLAAINEKLDKLEAEVKAQLELNGEGEWMLTFVKKGEKKDAC